MTFALPLRRIVTWAAVLLLAFVLLLGTAAALTDVADVSAALAHIGPVQLAPLLLLSSSAFVLRTLRWQLYSRAQGLRVPLLDNALIYIGGFALGATPGRIGEVVRLVLLRHGFGLPLRRTAPLLVADRLNDVNTLALLMVVGISYVLQQSELIVLALLLVVGINALLRFPAPLLRAVNGLYVLGGKRHRRIAAGLRRLLRRIRSTFDVRTQLGASLLSLAAWSVECASLYWILQALNTPIDIRAAVAIHATASLIGALSMLPGGIGGFEATCLALLVWQGIPAPQAVVATAVLRITTFWYSLLVGTPALVFALARVRRRARALRGARAA